MLHHRLCCTLLPRSPRPNQPSAPPHLTAYGSLTSHPHQASSMDKIREFFGTGVKRRGPIFLSDDEPGADDDRRNGAAATSNDHDNDDDAGQHASQQSLVDAGVREGNNTGLPSTQRNSAIVRHGRGLLSEDGDDDDDGRPSHRSARRSKHSSRRTNAAGQLSDDEDDADSIDQLLGSWNSKHTQGRRRSWRRYLPTWKTGLLYFFLFLLGLAFLAFAVIHMWIGRFVSEHMGDGGVLIKERAQDALVWRGPDQIKVVKMESDSTIVRVDMRMGIDVRTVFGWNTTTFGSERLHTMDNKKLSWSRRTERKLIGWATRRTGQASVDLPSPILLLDPSNITQAMAATGLQGPVVLPLYFPKSETYDADDLSWLKRISFTIPFQVLDPNHMASFINQTLEDKIGNIRIRVQEANLSLGKQEDRSWLSRIVSRYGGQKVEDIQVDQSFEVPDSPDMPDPDEMVQLKSYSLVAIPNNSTHRHKPGHNKTSLPDETLAIYASARIKNPAYEQMHRYSLDLDIPFAWPYKIFLTSPSSPKKNKTSGNLEKQDNKLVLLARGVVEPFFIPSDKEHFDVSINGTVEQTGNSSTPLSEALSAFISRYLAGKNNTVHVSFDSSSPYAKRIPSFLPPLLEPVVVSNIIPGLPPDQRDLLKDLKIDKMRIHAAENGGAGWECDGEIQGELAMPKALDQLQGGINVTSIWPDIILYDGLPPPSKTGQDDKAMPPNPLPANAFARFRTKDWQPAETFINERNQTIMRSMTKDIPLDILRREVLQKWIAKIIFSGGKGALTGIKGVTEARSTVRGFGEVELRKLPVFGTFYANKPNLMSLSTFGFAEEE